jgi:hypothetical protein
MGEGDVCSQFTPIQPKVAVTDCPKSGIQTSHKYRCSMLPLQTSRRTRTRLFPTVSGDQVMVELE